VSSPEVHDGDFRRSAEGRYPTKSIGSVHTYYSARSLPLPPPYLGLWRAEATACAEGHVSDDFRRAVRSATVAILGPKACMRAILVKIGERGDRLPI
jgi:hypothetical protein